MSCERHEEKLEEWRELKASKGPTPFPEFLGSLTKCSPSSPETGSDLQSHCVMKDGLELLIFLLLPPKRWHYRFGASRLVYAVLGIEPRAVCMLDKLPTELGSVAVR